MGTGTTVPESSSGAKPWEGREEPADAAPLPPLRLWRCSSIQASTARKLGTERISSRLPSESTSTMSPQAPKARGTERTSRIWEYTTWVRSRPSQPPFTSMRRLVMR